MPDPQQNIAIVQSLYRAFARRDIPSILSVLSPTVEWSEPPNPFNPAAGTRHGHDGFLEWLRAGHESEEVLVLEDVDLPVVGVDALELEQRGAVQAHLRAIPPVPR